MKMTASFQNREEALAKICDPTGTALLNVYGEAGIGKSRLLQESAQRMRANSPPSVVLQVDFGSLAEAPVNRVETLVRTLIAQAESRLSVTWQNVEQAVGEVVAQLNRISETPVVLMFDTTETFQEDMEFWDWIEANLVGPLAVEGHVRQVFAGRVPVPWRGIQVRRIVTLLSLEPLPARDAARELVREVLRQHNSRLEDQAMEQAIDLVLEFSFGHPLLCEKLAAYAASHWPEQLTAGIKRDLCKQVVRPFIEEHFFVRIGDSWDQILWWASVLDRFDATILRRYLERVAPPLIKDHPDYYFTQGIARLRIQKTVVWREERGDRLYGVIGDIVRRCFKVMDAEGYSQACQAATETFEALADEFPEGSAETQQYHQEAETYRMRLEQEVQQ
jgi:hypothetical protein